MCWVLAVICSRLIEFTHFPLQRNGCRYWYCAVSYSLFTVGAWIFLCAWSFQLILLKNWCVLSSVSFSPPLKRSPEKSLTPCTRSQAFGFQVCCISEKELQYMNFNLLWRLSECVHSNRDNFQHLWCARVLYVICWLFGLLMVVCSTHTGTGGQVICGRLWDNLHVRVGCNRYT